LTFPGSAAGIQRSFLIPDYWLLIPGIERPACFEIVPTARAVSGAGKNATRISSQASLFGLAATVECEDAWSMRTVLNSASRSDQERSPLHDVKQHAHCQGSLGGRESFHLWTSENGLTRARRAIFFAGTRSERHRGREGPALGEPEQKRTPTRSF